MRVIIFWILAFLLASPSQASFCLCQNDTQSHQLNSNHSESSEEAPCHGEKPRNSADSSSHSQEEKSSHDSSTESCCYLSSCCQSAAPQNKSTAVIEIAEGYKTFFVPTLSPKESPFIPLEPPKS